MAVENSPPDRITILSMDVNLTTIEQVVSKIHDWARKGEGRSVCVANVHMCMEVFDDEEFRGVVNQADLVVPDGRPLVWAQRLLGFTTASQVRGEDLTLALCRSAEDKGLRIGLFGGTEEVLGTFTRSLTARFPRLQIVYTYSPPFRPLSDEETTGAHQAIEKAGVQILFVGLGCPKQERWMADNRSQVNAVMLGVGAAFDFIAGAKPGAPRWVQRAGLEWLFRLLVEPKRLWRRYIKQNPRFVWYFARQALSKTAKT